MKKINLAEPFETLWTTISCLPLTQDPISQRTRETFKETNVQQLLREIYQAANGRQVATTIGLVAVAPPIATHLKDEPFFVETQADFFFQAMCRLAEHTRKRARCLPSKPALSSTNGGDVVQLQSTPKCTNDWRKDSCMRVG